MTLIHEEESYQVLGACFEVYREVGAGFTEPIYQECLEMELAMQGIAFRSQPELAMTYKQQRMVKTFRPDFIVFDKILVEIKALASLCDDHRAQLQNYLHATELRLGFLINFGHFPKLEYERFAN